MEFEVENDTVRAPLSVCFFAENCLAESYLGQVLQGSRNIRAVPLRNISQLARAKRAHTVLVIDLSGLELPLREYIKRLEERCIDPKFVALDHQKTNNEIVRLMLSGIHGYVPHEEVRRTLVHAIFSVAANQLWVPPGALQQFLSEVGSALRRKNSEGGNSTTPREEEVLELVRKRLSNREIANVLKIRVSTVKFHLSNILSKLHATNRYQLNETCSGKLCNRGGKGQELIGDRGRECRTSPGVARKLQESNKATPSIC
jgi:DNA-binding NarL/FixJ family response regulator